MIRVAFCDDDLSVLKELSELVDRYGTERNCEIISSAYHSPFDLMADMERGQVWDILLLDVLMPGENGMELAKEIRARDETVKLIFLTSTPEFAVQSYTVGATYYQLKPVAADSLFPILDRAVAACSSARNENLILRCRTGIVAVAPDKLEYCEAGARRLFFHLGDGQVLESIGKLNDLEQKLASLGGFLRVHRSYLVNMAYIQNISYRTILLRDQTEIPIPHGKFNDVKAAYLAYAFEKERVML